MLHPVLAKPGKYKTESVFEPALPDGEKLLPCTLIK
jgi:hypothetical protein